MSVMTRVPLLPCLRICTDGIMTFTLSRPETAPVIYTLIPGEQKPCVLCELRFLLEKYGLITNGEGSTGYVAVVGIVLCVICVSLVLPAMWAVVEKRSPPEEKRNRNGQPRP